MEREEAARGKMASHGQRACGDQRGEGFGKKKGEQRGPELMLDVAAEPCAGRMRKGAGKRGSDAEELPEWKVIPLNQPFLHISASALGLTRCQSTLFP